MSNILRVKYKYFPYAMPEHKWRQSKCWFDEAKMNLLWLAMPGVDELAKEYWPGNEISASICRHLDGTLRHLLKTLPPLGFMREFNKMDSGDFFLTEPWPANYLETMWRRAREAEVRLVGDIPQNVVKVDFSSKIRFGFQSF